MNANVLIRLGELLEAGQITLDQYRESVNAASKESPKRGEWSITDSGRVRVTKYDTLSVRALVEIAEHPEKLRGIVDAVATEWADGCEPIEVSSTYRDRETGKEKPGRPKFWIGGFYGGSTSNAARKLGERAVKLADAKVEA